MSTETVITTKTNGATRPVKFSGDVLVVNPTGGTEEAFRDAVPYAADADGRFSTSAAMRWLQATTGCSQGSASGTVFCWSDPTEISGVRRFRTETRRRHREDLPEKTFKNVFSGTKVVEGWDVNSVLVVTGKHKLDPRMSYADRRTQEEVDKEFFSRLDGKLTPKGDFTYKDFFGGLSKMERQRLTPMFYRKVRLYARKLPGRGCYCITEFGRETMRRLLQGSKPINTEAANDRPAPKPVIDLHPDHPANNPVPLDQFTNPAEHIAIIRDVAAETAREAISIYERDFPIQPASSNGDIVEAVAKTIDAKFLAIAVMLGFIATAVVVDAIVHVIR